MSTKAKEETNDKEITYAKVQTRCGLKQANLMHAIESKDQEIELPTANIGQLSSEVEALGAEIAQLGLDVMKAVFQLPAHGLPSHGCHQLPAHGSRQLPVQGCRQLPAYGKRRVRHGSHAHDSPVRHLPFHPTTHCTTLQL